MPKRNPDGIPAIKKNSKGEYYCSIQRKKIYLGRNLKTARERLLRKLMEDSPAVGVAGGRQEMVVLELIEKYLVKMKDHSHFDKVKIMCRTVLEAFGEMPLAEFGPLAMARCRQCWVERDLTRNYVNKLTGWVVRMFAWGVSQEMVPYEVVARLQTLEPLKLGEARDNPPREDVKNEDVVRTLPFLTPIVRDMVILQRISGMRPSELFRMTLEQFTRRDEDVWVYQPFQHKTKRHSKTRVIAFGRFEIAILHKYAVETEPTRVFFSPRTAWEQRGWHLGGNRAAETFTRDTYNAAVQRAIKQANANGECVARWTPYQLRHAAATFISLLLDEAAASTALGHATPHITRLYDHSAVEKAARMVRERDAKGRIEIEKLINAVEKR
ncbi:MAG: site-specific integrase [Planctomycetia bacterium]|nr:site-specific integrase [Planctomycetia bacterium]